MVRTTKKNSSLKKILIGVVLFALVACAGGIYYFSTRQGETGKGENDYHYLEYKGQTYKYNSDIISILCLGIDSKDGEQGQSDAINMVLLDRKNKEINLLSLSRDIMCDIELFNAAGNSIGYDKQHLALAYANGSSAEQGCKLASDAVSKLLGNIPVVNYASFNMSEISAFHEVVNTLEVTVPDDLLVKVNSSWTRGTTIQLTSNDAESFLRARDTNVDFSNEIRMARQDVYIKAYVSKLREMLAADFNGTIEKLYQPYQHACSNLTIGEITDYAQMMLTYDFDIDKNFYKLEGTYQKGLLHDEVVVNENDLKMLEVKIFYKKGD